MNLLPHGSFSSPFFFPEFDTDVGQAKSQTPNNPWKTGPGESKGLGNVISLLNVEYKPEFVQLHPLEGGGWEDAENMATNGFVFWDKIPRILRNPKDTEKYNK